MDPRRRTHILNEIKKAKKLGVAYVPPKEPDSPKRVLSVRIFYCHERMLFFYFVSNFSFSLMDPWDQEVRRKKLEDVKRREEMKTKRYRLFNILIHKLIQKFGP